MTLHTEDQARDGWMNTMVLRNVGDWYLYCGGCTGRIFLEFQGGTYWVTADDDGRLFLMEVEPHRPAPRKKPEKRSWWSKICGPAGKPEQAA